MSTSETPPYRLTPQRLTQLEAALSEQLHESNLPVVTSYRLFHELRELYESGRKLRLRKALPDYEELKMRRSHLVKANVLMPDPDYSHRAFRVIQNSDRSAEEICCLVDPFCYIAHLSAMERYGLTDRRPKALHLSKPRGRPLQELVRQTMAHDYGDKELKQLEEYQIVKLRGVNHPEKVRDRSLSVFSTVHPGDWIRIRGTYARISTIGQTFADMLEVPSACGGMAHVLDVWREHAAIHLDDIIAAVDKSPHGIAKVRAGYILDEYLGLTDQRVEAWIKFVQRGGSRVLDPEAPFAPNYSEKWMLSLNALR